MAAAAESGRGVPGLMDDPLKRQPWDNPVPEAWLVEAGQVRLADGVDRIAGDVDLVTAMALSNYEGPSWEYFANEVAKYGAAVIASWLGRGMIFERCRSRGLGGLPPMDRPFTEDEVCELTNETVAKAIWHFRHDVLLKRRWDPGRGATLRTFFVGQCLIRFPNIYRRWRAGEMRNVFVLGEDLGEPPRADEVEAPDKRVVAGIVASLAMETIRDPRVRRAMYMTAAGWPQAEIASVLGVSEKAVERMLANERGRLRRRGVA